MRHERTDTLYGFEPGKDKIMDEITYTNFYGYLLPNLALSDPPDAPPVGYYGRRHIEYLRKEKPVLYSRLLLSERLFPLAREIDEAAKTRLATIPDRNTANEIILSELVYC